MVKLVSNIEIKDINLSGNSTILQGNLNEVLFDYTVIVARY